VNGHTRTLAQQRSWLINKSKKTAPPDSSVNYSIHRDWVVVKKPGRFSKKLILQWLTEMS